MSHKGTPNSINFHATQISTIKNTANYHISHLKLLEISWILVIKIVSKHNLNMNWWQNMIFMGDTKSALGDRRPRLVNLNGKQEYHI